MKRLAKWVLIIWSIFCLLGAIAGMASVGGHIGQLSDEAQKTGATIGLGCGMAMWVGIWAAIALPALIVYLVTGKKESVHVVVESDRISTLCKECGKYYEGKPSFCPNCGKPIS